MRPGTVPMRQAAGLKCGGHEQNIVEVRTVGTEKQAGGEARLRFSRRAFAVLAWALLLCIVVQTLIAGAAVFGNAERWKMHVLFVHLFEYLPLLMVVFAFAGKLPPVLKWHNIALLVLIVLQYTTANVAAVGALHPVIALVMFWLSLTTARKSLAAARA